MAGAGVHWDERRNTSRRRDAPPGAAAALLAHLAEHRGAEWYRWPIAYMAAQRAGVEPPAVHRCGCGRHVTTGETCTCGKAR